MMRHALFVRRRGGVAAIAHAQAPIYNKGPAYNPASVAETGGTIDGVAFGGTVAADQAAAGKIGEYQEVNCGIPAASGTTVAFTNASPTVGTWTTHPFQQTNVGFSNVYACPFTITANAPTGLSTATNYWAVPIDANTFHVRRARRTPRPGRSPTRPARPRRRT
jgi:hypothetical protein